MCKKYEGAKAVAFLYLFKDDKTLQDIARYRFVEGLTIPETAMLVGYSERQVQRLCKKIELIAETGGYEMTENEILQTAIKVFGDAVQEGVAIEECAELIQAISHKHRGRAENIAEEIADVEIMLEQLKIINNCREEVAEIHQQKIERLYNKVFDECL
jgi:hypothetical protein